MVSSSGGERKTHLASYWTLLNRSNYLIIQDTVESCWQVCHTQRDEDEFRPEEYVLHIVNSLEGIPCA